AKFICGGPQFLISEFFFWSSPTEQEMKERYGSSLEEHQKFCYRMNAALFDLFKPRAVIVVGLGQEEKAKNLLGNLRHVKSYPDDRILEHYENERSWLFVKHPASRLSIEARKNIAAYIQALG
ncbi:MAG TPA: hypothetical protein VGC86_16530, partial [Afipia sp.]